MSCHALTSAITARQPAPRDQPHGEGSVSTTIPASIDASLELATDGTVLASDGVNAINGAFKATSAGFDIYGGPTTLAAYGGNDPGVLAAESG